MAGCSRNSHFAAPPNLPTTGIKNLLLAGDDRGDLSDRIVAT